IITESGEILVDLRIGSARGLLANPYCSSGEANIMREFVRDGDVVLDIGAHLGFYTVHLSNLVGTRGKVYAFELNTALLPNLRTTLGARPNIRLFEFGLSNKDGRISLFIPEDASMASLSNWTDGRAGKVVTSPCDVK